MAAFACFKRYQRPIYCDINLRNPFLSAFTRVPSLNPPRASAKSPPRAAMAWPSWPGNNRSAIMTELDTLYGGCGVPGYTLQINPQDLIALTRAQVFDFTEPEEKT
jgi:hypothetical protein